MFGGIIVGNMGMWKMMDAYQESKSAVHEMFQTGEVTDPISPQAKRTEAIRQYQENQPDGPFHKMMQYGQVLTVAGALVMIFGALI